MQAGCTPKRRRGEMSPELDIDPFRHLWENTAKTDIQLNIFQYLDIRFEVAVVQIQKLLLAKNLR